MSLSTTEQLITLPSELEPYENNMTFIVTCKIVRDFSPIYTTTNQKADICNSYQVVM